jgi:hypothetical protein
VLIYVSPFFEGFIQLAQADFKIYIFFQFVERSNFDRNRFENTLRLLGKPLYRSDK